MKDWNYSGIAFLNELCGSACFRAAQGFQDCCAGFVVYSREQRAKWLLADIWRLPRGSNTPLLCSAASLIPRCLQRGL